VGDDWQHFEDLMTRRTSPFGPWLGVPKARQHLCAIDGCEADGKSHRCPADDSMHFHGCVHYETTGEDLYVKHQLKLRHGWGLLCDAHYEIVRAIIEDQQLQAKLPSPLCVGNPTKQECIKHGYCTRKPACNE
jgi:hypothetical protein